MKKIKLRKSFAALMMAFVMLLSVLPTAAFAAETSSAPAEGSYLVPVAELKSGAPIPAIANEFAKSFGTQVQVDVDAAGKMTATIIPQHMLVNFMGQYHCNLLKLRSTAGEAAYPEMRTEKSSPEFNKPANVVDMTVPAKMVVVLPEQNSDGAYPLELTCDMMNAMSGDVAQDHWMDVTLTLDWAKAEAVAPSFEFGTAKTVLEPGKYTLPVSLMNASHIEKPSMAASCVKGGSLEVMEDGSAFVTVDLGPVTVGPLTGWSSEWNIYTESDYTKIGEESEKTPAEILTKDDAGNATAIRFELPYTDQDGVYTQMYVALMTMRPDAYLALDFANAEKAVTPEPQPEPEPETPDYTFGTAKTVLEPGKYTLPVSLMNASHIENPSMAASCIKGGALEVMEDGSAFVTVDLGPVTVGTLTGWSSEWNIYAEPDYAKITEESEKTPAEILTKDDAGNATAIRFELPYTNQDGVYAQMYVALMTMRPDAYLALDFANAEKAVTPEPQPEQKIADGNYYVDAYLWHETQDKASMGDTAMKDNRQVLVTVTDGIVTNVQVATAPVTMSTITSGIIDIKVAGKDVEILKKASFTTAPAGNEYEYIQLFQFALPAEAQPAELAGVTYVPVQFKVPDTPMGDDFMDARIKLDWASAAVTEDTQITLPEPKPEQPDLELMDEATGVKIFAPKGTFDEEVMLVVEKITAGEAYENAAAVVKSVGEKFELYAIRFVNAAGEEVKAMGPVTISVPVSDNFNADALVMYRINADGTKTLVRGEVEDGYFVFLQKTFGTYALVEEGSVIENEGTTPEKPEKPEIKPEQPETKPEAKPETPAEKPEDSTAPETGDSTPLVMLSVAALTAAAGAAFVISAKRRNEN